MQCGDPVVNANTYRKIQHMLMLQTQYLVVSPGCVQTNGCEVWITSWCVPMIHDDEASWFIMTNHNDYSSWWVILMHHNDLSWRSSWGIKMIHHDEQWGFIIVSHHDTSWHLTHMGSSGPRAAKVVSEDVVRQLMEGLSSIQVLLN